jgi:uncharacterized protein (UPF0248 family)
MTMRTSHTLLLKYFHDPRFIFQEVTVCYVDRGAPGDVTCVHGDQIVHFDAYYFEITSPSGATPIPYHRITRILYNGEPVWARREDKKKQGT